MPPSGLEGVRRCKPLGLKGLGDATLWD